MQTLISRIKQPMNKMGRAVLLVIKYTPNIFLTGAYVCTLPRSKKIFAMSKCVQRNLKQFFLGVTYSVFVGEEYGICLFCLIKTNFLITIHIKSERSCVLDTKKYFCFVLVWTIHVFYYISNSVVTDWGWKNKKN